MITMVKKGDTNAEGLGLRTDLGIQGVCSSGGRIV